MPDKKEYTGPERRGNYMTSSEAIIAIHNECKAVNDRITGHKQEQNDRFDKLDNCIGRLDSRIDMLVDLSEKRTEELKKVKELLVSENGESGAILRIINLENRAKEQDKLMSRVMTLIWGLATAIGLYIISWLGKAVLYLIRTIGG